MINVFEKKTVLLIFNNRVFWCTKIVFSKNLKMLKEIFHSEKLKKFYKLKDDM